jgi:hypothetical protein
MKLLAYTLFIFGILALCFAEYVAPSKELERKYVKSLFEIQDYLHNQPNTENNKKPNYDFIAMNKSIGVKNGLSQICSRIGLVLFAASGVLICVITAKKQKPNQALEPTATAVTDSAAQTPRQL